MASHNSSNIYLFIILFADERIWIMEKYLAYYADYVLPNW